jgi:hypothetical protein
VLRTKGQGGVVAGKSVSHPTATQLGRGATAGVRRYRDDGDGLGDGAYGDTGVTEID